jgi:hypothetical protein
VGVEVTVGVEVGVAAKAIDALPHKRSTSAKQSTFALSIILDTDTFIYSIPFFSKLIIYISTISNNKKLTSF